MRVFGELVGSVVCVGGGRKKKWIGLFLDDLRAFGIDADRWTTACSRPGRGEMVQDGGTGGGPFHGKKDRRRELRAGLRHGVVCPNMTGRKKGRVCQSERARAGSLDMVD